MLLFRSRRRLLCSFLLAWLALDCAHATSVIIISGRAELFVGADGGWTRHSLSGTGAPVPHCMLEQYAAVFVAHAGGAYLTAHDAKGKLAVVLDIRPIVEAAMKTTGGLDAKANALDLSFWRTYRRVVHEVASWPASAIRNELIDQLGLEEFAVVGHSCPVRSRRESTDCWSRISRFRSRRAEVPVKWGFSRKGLG